MTWTLEYFYDNVCLFQLELLFYISHRSEYNCCKTKAQTGREQTSF